MIQKEVDLLNVTRAMCFALVSLAGPEGRPFRGLVAAMARPTKGHDHSWQGQNQVLTKPDGGNDETEVDLDHTVHIQDY